MGFGFLVKNLMSTEDQETVNPGQQATNNLQVVHCLADVYKQLACKLSFVEDGIVNVVCEKIE